VLSSQRSLKYARSLASEPEFRRKTYRWQLGYRAAALADANFAMLIDAEARTSSTVAPC